MPGIHRTNLLAAALVLAIGSASSGAQESFQPMDVFQLEFAADPQISPDGSQVVYARTSMDIMRDRPASGAVARERGRQRPSAAKRRLVASLVPGRHPHRLHRGRPDPASLDGYRRNGHPHPASRIAEEYPLVARRPVARLQHAGALSPAATRRAPKTASRRGVGRPSDHGGPLQEPAGRGGLSRLRLRPPLRSPGRRRYAGPGHFGRLSTLEPRRLDAGRPAPRLLLEPQPRLGARLPELRALHRAGGGRGDPGTDWPGRAGPEPRRLSRRAADRVRGLRGPGAEPTRSADSRS